jgi:hypothetical protein
MEENMMMMCQQVYGRIWIMKTDNKALCTLVTVMKFITPFWNKQLLLRCLYYFNTWKYLTHNVQDISLGLGES